MSYCNTVTECVLDKNMFYIECGQEFLMSQSGDENVVCLMYSYSWQTGINSQRLILISYYYALSVNYFIGLHGMNEGVLYCIIKHSFGN